LHNNGVTPSITTLMPRLAIETPVEDEPWFGKRCRAPQSRTLPGPGLPYPTMPSRALRCRERKPCLALPRVALSRLA
jgi:hypothetical protein